MAFTARCSSCGSVELTVWAQGDHRRCVECVERLEFVPGPSRRVRGFLRWRVLRDDQFDERRSHSERSAERELVPEGGRDSVKGGGVVRSGAVGESAYSHGVDVGAAGHFPDADRPHIFGEGLPVIRREC